MTEREETKMIKSTISSKSNQCNRSFDDLKTKKIINEETEEYKQKDASVLSTIKPSTEMIRICPKSSPCVISYIPGFCFDIERIGSIIKCSCNLDQFTPKDFGGVVLTLDIGQIFEWNGKSWCLSSNQLSEGQFYASSDVQSGTDCFQFYQKKRDCEPVCILSPIPAGIAIVTLPNNLTCVPFVYDGICWKLCQASKINNEDNRVRLTNIPKDFILNPQPEIEVKKVKTVEDLEEQKGTDHLKESQTKPTEVTNSDDQKTNIEEPKKPRYLWF